MLDSSICTIVTEPGIGSLFGAFEARACVFISLFRGCFRWQVCSCLLLDCKCPMCHTLRCICISCNLVSLFCSTLFCNAVFEPLQTRRLHTCRKILPPAFLSHVIPVLWQFRWKEWTFRNHLLLTAGSGVAVDDYGCQSARGFSFRRYLFYCCTLQNPDSRFTGRVFATVFCPFFLVVLLYLRFFLKALMSVFANTLAIPIVLDNRSTTRKLDLIRFLYSTEHIVLLTW